MLQDYSVAVTSLGAAENHLAVARCPDGSAGFSRIIHALVGTDLVQDGMLPAGAEIGRDAGELNGIAEKCFSETIALGCVISCFSGRAGITDGTIGFAAVNELSGNDFVFLISIVDSFTVLIILFIDNSETIAFLHILPEIDIPFEYIHKFIEQM